MEPKIPYIHNGKGTVRACVYGRLDLLDFVKQIFGAVELERNKLPNGFYVQAQIGDSVIVLSATDPPYKDAREASVYVYVEDVDMIYKRALAAGATSVDPPTDRPWQGRMAGVKDCVVARCIRQSQDHHLIGTRIAKPHRIEDGFAEFRHLILADQMSGSEMPHHLPQADTDRNIGQHQHGTGSV